MSKKFMSLALCIAMLLSAISLTASISAAETYTPETGDGYVSFDLTKISNGICLGRKSASAEKTTFDGKDVFKITPTPELNVGGDSATTVNIDITAIGNHSVKVDVTKYKYIGIEYYYDTAAPTYTGKMRMNILEGSSKATKGNFAVESDKTITTGKWDVVYLSMQGLVINPDSSKNYLSQIHFFPFGTTHPDKLKNSDVIYVSKCTFYETNPTGGETFDIPTVTPGEKEEEKPTVEAPVDAPVLSTENTSMDAPVFEKGEGYISFDMTKLPVGIAVGRKSAALQKVTYDGRNALKVVPTPHLNVGGDMATTINIDGSSYAKYDEKVDLSKYRYMSVTYYYDTDSPTYDGNMKFNVISGDGGKARGNLVSTNTLVTGKWAECYFSFGATVTYDEGASLKQAHFFPYGGSNPSVLKFTDVMYISKITFHETNPDENARYKISFDSSNPEVSGTRPEDISVKPDSSYTLPECPYTLSYGTFTGWKCDLDGVVYMPGDTLVAKSDTHFEAMWEEKKEYPDNKVLFFPDYANGIVNGLDSASVYDEECVIDGMRVLKICANPEATKAKTLCIEGYSYDGANIDLSVYKWIIVAYKYDSPTPAKTKMRINYMTNGGALSKQFGNTSSEELVAGKWSFAKFDMTGVEACLNPDSKDHYLKQMHTYVFGSELPVKNLTKDDTVYISHVMFFKEEPKLAVHEPYMNGYDGNVFKPNKTMTRAEACTVVARLLDTEENIAKNTTTSFNDVAANKWYAKYISFCEAKGLLKSYSGAFAPEQNITRAEFAELVYNMGLAKEDPADRKTFTDVTEAHPKYAAIMAAASAGLIGGYADGTFLPDRTITRAQVVTVLNRARGRSMTTDTISPEISAVFNDVDGTHWAFAEIAEATLPHVSDGKAWLYAMKDPNEYVDVDYSKGNAMIAEVDRLSAERAEKIANSASDYSTIKGKKIYVSPNGDDANDGLSPEKAVKTVARANRIVSSGDGVLFERGGLWREKFSAVPGATYSAYGEGQKPRIYGSPENGAVPEKWTLFHEDASTGAKIWKYENEDFADVGNIVFDHKYYGYKEFPSYKNGRFVLRNTDTPFDIKTHLDRNLEFFHKADSVTDGNGPTTAATGPLYLRCDAGNPGEIYEDIEFSTRGNVIGISGANTTIDNLAIMYGGSHGVGAGTVTGLTVKNCIIAWIGGSIQSYNLRGNTPGVVTRFGNGVEVYGGCEGYTVENNHIYQNYDAGITNQVGSGNANEILMNNISYSHNLIEDCVYSIEYFLGAPKSGSARRDGVNFKIDDNIMRRAGFGFGSTRGDGGAQVHLKTWGGTPNEFKNFVISNNIFDRSVNQMFYVCAGYDVWLPKWQNNTYIHGFDKSFANYGRASGNVYRYNYTAHNVITNIMGDADAKIFYVEPEPSYTFTGGK